MALGQEISVRYVCRFESTASRKALCLFIFIAAVVRMLSSSGHELSLQ